MVAGESKPIVEKDVLRRLAESRLNEAQALDRAGHYQGAIYLAGYAVECWLKVAICQTLDWEGLHETFKSHDLKHLLLHSGLVRRIDKASAVSRSFKQIIGMWPKDGGVELRYRDPQSYSEEQARVFLQWVTGEKEGVVPWLCGQVS
jgi:HEPN domain-containing protein